MRFGTFFGGTGLGLGLGRVHVRRGSVRFEMFLSEGAGLGLGRGLLGVVGEIGTWVFVWEGLGLGGGGRDDQQ